MLTLILIAAIAIPAALAYVVARKLDARDRAAGRFLPTGGSPKPAARTTGRLLF